MFVFYKIYDIGLVIEKVSAHLRFCEVLEILFVNRILSSNHPVFTTTAACYIISTLCDIPHKELSDCF